MQQMDLKPEALARRSVCYYDIYYKACGLGLESNVKYDSIPVPFSNSKYFQGGFEDFYNYAI